MSMLVISLTLDQPLLADVDARAKALDLNRSQYFRRLARVDLGYADLARESVVPRVVQAMKEDQPVMAAE